jgi:hypothetical protein
MDSAISMDYSSTSPTAVPPTAVSPAAVSPAAVSPAVAPSAALSDDELAAKFKKMSQREHVYHLTDSYVGSAELVPVTQSLYNPSSKQMAEETVSYVPALFKIADELLVNSWDQRVRTFEKHKTDRRVRRVSRIDIVVDAETSALQVTNDGDGIDIGMHPEHGVYTVELPRRREADGRQERLRREAGQHLLAPL